MMCAAWGCGRHPPNSRAPLPFIIRCLAQLFITGFHRFLARFSGRRRPHGTFHQKPPPWTIFTLVILSLSSLFNIVDACSSRTTPKPRPPTPRPNVTFPTYECPPEYAAWYCLNGASCFTVRIGESLLYNCECSPGYMGIRCEYKDLDRSYLQSRRNYMLSQASIAGGVTIAVFLVVIVCAMTYLHYKRRAKLSSVTSKDCVDGIYATEVFRPTFGVKLKRPPPCTAGAGGAGAANATTCAAAAAPGAANTTTSSTTVELSLSHLKRPVPETTTSRDFNRIATTTLLTTAESNPL